MPSCRGGDILTLEKPSPSNVATIQPKNVNLSKYLKGKNIRANMPLINGCHDSNLDARLHAGLRKLVKHIFVCEMLCQFNECILKTL